MQVRWILKTWLLQLILVQLILKHKAYKTLLWLEKNLVGSKMAGNLHSWNRYHHQCPYIKDASHQPLLELMIPGKTSPFPSPPKAQLFFNLWKIYWITPSSITTARNHPQVVCEKFAKRLASTIATILSGVRSMIKKRPSQNNGDFANRYVIARQEKTPINTSVSKN